MERTKIKLDLVILGVISFLILVWNTWTGSLLSWDEGLYGAVSKEIVRTGNWIDLYWAGVTWSDKPPLYMWVTAFFYNIFGINEFSVRLFSVLCGTGTVLATYLLARELYSRKAAICSSLVLLSTWHFIWSSKLGMLDITLTFFIALSILLFKLGEENNWLLFLSPLAFSCAFLTKGAGAMIIPIILFLYIIVTGKFRLLISPPLIAGVILSLVILFWWHMMVFLSYGEEFIQSYFVKHLLTRTTTAVEGHTGDFFTYFGVIPNKGRPWGWVTLGLIPILAWRVVKNKETEHLLPLVWAVSVLLLFSTVKTKLHWYIMPLYPSLSIMAGWGISKLFKKYAVTIAVCLSIFSVLYLALDKDIFDADYSPRIKETSQNVIEATPLGKTLFLYDISDPGMQFYLGWGGQNIHTEEEFQKLSEEEDTYVLLNKRHSGEVSKYKCTLIAEYPDYLLIRTD